MTAPAREHDRRHDSVIDVSGRSGQGSPRQTIRVPEPLWILFGELAEPDRSAIIRAFIAWYVREPGAKLPRRPPETA